ncbi:MAG: DUF106 domain-containing protein [Promethearchaeota archaeon]|nr:MAG: DUF106 domain-containing protein [Candidatus Lokiarchaeota archaeon]
MTAEEIILQIFLITIGITLFSLLLNKLLGLNPEKMKELREKALNLQERMQNAQAIGDPGLMQSLQMESMQLMKDMMKKQLLPMCIRCGIFIGILAFLNFIYADYATGLLPFPILFFGDGWFAIYFLFAIAFSLIIYASKKLYYKITGKQSKRQSFAKELMGSQSPLTGGMGGGMSGGMDGMLSMPGTGTTRQPQSPQQASSGMKPMDYRDQEGKQESSSSSWKQRLEYKESEEENN